MTALALSLTIDRTSLSLSDLVITNVATSNGFWIADVQEPGFEFRYNYAPDSMHAPGSTLLAAVLEQSSLPVVIKARAASTAALRTLRTELETAVSQFAYDLTLTIDGDSQTWAADPVFPTWATDWGFVTAHMASTSLSFRVNPPGA